MRFSLTGGQVDWTIYVSFPLTFSIICTLTSPSAKRPTWDLPISHWRISLISWVRDRLELPEKRTNLFWSRIFSGLSVDWEQFR